MADDCKAKIAVYEAQRAHELELNRATAAFEHAVLSPLFLLNGGAAVAFLTLLGAASANDSTLAVNPWAAGLAASTWSAGLVAATWAARAGYESQRAFTQSVKQRRRLIEYALVKQAADFVDALKPLAGADQTSASEPPTGDPGDSEALRLKDAAIKDLVRWNDPAVEFENGEKHQESYKKRSTWSGALFAVGVAFAAVAVLWESLPG